jgi:type IV secretion system protein TrbB
VVTAPAFAIRKPAVAVFTLDDYVAAGIMSAGTTLTNTLLAEVAKTSDRMVIIEDTRELQCAAPNLVAMRTKDGVASLSDLVRSSLRLRPDCIPVGEVRGSEALDLLKAWGAGHLPAVSGRSMPGPPSARFGGWSSSSRKPSSPYRAR